MSKPTPYNREHYASQPPLLHPGYKSTVARSPSQPLVELPHSLSEITGPLYGQGDLGPDEDDLTRQHVGEPIGQRIIVSGRVTGENGEPVPNVLVEVWQCNSAGRYAHPVDQHDAPLDPNFSGAGRCVTDAEGNYRFTTIEPGAYPWGNHPNAWRPKHIHFSLFGNAHVTRLVTQMYFPGDSLLPLDPIFHSVGDPEAREALVASLDMENAIPDQALAYRFDIVLRGRGQTPSVK